MLLAARPIDVDAKLYVIPIGFTFPGVAAVAVLLCIATGPLFVAGPVHVDAAEVCAG